MEHAHAIEEEETLADPYWELIQYSLNEKAFDRTAELLTTLEQKLGFEFQDLTQVPAYQGFTKSEAYEKWIKERSAVTPDEE